MHAYDPVSSFSILKRAPWSSRRPLEENTRIRRAVKPVRDLRGFDRAIVFHKPNVDRDRV